MSFDSVDFLLFFPIVALLYYVIPNKTRFNFRNMWLLIASYYFYMSWNAKYAVLILFSTVITYICGLLIDKELLNQINSKLLDNKKIILAFGLLINILILSVFKYGNFILHNVYIVLKRITILESEPHLDLLLPVGISFYTFQALGYIIDVYRGEIKAEKSFIKYALFVSFFPQLVAGPIERSKNLLHQLEEEHKFDLDIIRDGLLMMLWGFFMKLVIADRAALFVDTVYNDYLSFPGWYLIVATILFGFQIYCDFNGYTLIARGAARIMGFSLMENFNAPYLSLNVGEFWRRWHISLTSWFKDYLYIPLGGNRKGKVRKYINILIVFGVSGLWHGANWTFVIWGLLNGMYQVVGSLLMPIRNKIVELLRLHRSSFGHRLASTIVTFGLVDFAWMFFRAKSFSDSISIAKSMITAQNVWILVDHESIFNCGLDRYDFELLVFAIIILFIADVFKVKKIQILRDIIYKQDTWFRWTYYIVSFLFVLIFGIWGCEYENAAFLYFQF